MPKFEDTPKWKREMRWDPAAQKLVPPPTRQQVEYLRDLCTEEGIDFEAPETKRQAQSQIQKALNRRERVAAPAPQPESSPWRFGEGQTPAEELREIRDAKARGLEQEYATRQRWVRMRAAETERKREVKRSRAA